MVTYTEQELQKIFQRIGLIYDKSETPTFELAAKIQYAFQSHIPYENSDIIRGIPLSLDYHDLYEKIITRHRGGYCFEINGFLAQVYRSLGFGVTEYMARYLRGETEIPVRRHRVIGVTVANGRKYICDAGIGQSAYRVPLLMEDGTVSEQYDEKYRVEKLPFFGWTISDFHKGEWRRFYSFTEEEQLNIDYIMPSYWCEHSPDSPFIHAEMFSIKTATGRKTLDGHTYREFDGDSVIEREISESELPKIYLDVFGLV